MSAKTRIILIVALGVFLGLMAWLPVEGYSPSPGVEDVFSSRPIWIVFFAFLIAVPLIVGRWWVVASVAGLFIALATLELTGQIYEGLGDGPEKPLGSLWVLPWYALLLLILVAVRKLFDFFRTCRRSQSVAHLQ